jgi:hypothetical protein
MAGQANGIWPAAGFVDTEIRCFTNVVALILAILTAALPMIFINCWCERRAGYNVVTT